MARQQTTTNGQRVAVGLMFALLAALAPGAGCVAVEAAAHPENRPTLHVRDVEFHGISAERLTLLFDVEVTNHYHWPLPLVSSQCDFNVQGQRLLQGTAGPVPTIPAGATQRVKAIVDVRFADLAAGASAVRPGRLVDYAADLTFWYEAPVLGRLSVATHYESKFPVPAAPDIDVVGVDRTDGSWPDPAVVVRLRVRNTNEFPVDVDALGFMLMLDGQVALAGAVAEPLRFAAGEELQTSVRGRISLEALGRWSMAWAQGKRVEYALTGRCRLVTPYGMVDTPLDRHGWTRRRSGADPDADPL